MSTSALANRLPASTRTEAELRGEIFPNQQPAWLTEAVVATLHGARGLVKRVAIALGVREKAVYEVGDASAPRALKAAWIPALVLETGSFAILDALERQVGRVAFPIVTKTDRQDVLQQALAREVTAFGEFLSETAADMADGRISESELRRILPEMDSLVARTLEFRALVIAKARTDAAA